MLLKVLTPLRQISGGTAAPAIGSVDSWDNNINELKCFSLPGQSFLYRTSKWTISFGRPFLVLHFLRWTWTLDISVPGTSNMASWRIFSMIDFKPRAPVLLSCKCKLVNAFSNEVTRQKEKWQNFTISNYLYSLCDFYHAPK